ncbi:MAG: undecaprenyl-diphosphate phosphatase [Thermodesulfovibrionia bacterium]|nr:undecaprenyl-diphosphate phosphatase [Thermodesulfovibrionia bacterium]
MFEVFQAIILGILQGLTEFLPVSSSAHLIILPWFLKWEGIINSLSFDVALHFGTLIALLYYFKKDWVDMFKGVPSKEGLFRDLVIGTLPAVTVGLFLHEWISSLRDPLIIIYALCAVSVLMILIEKKYHPAAERSDFYKIDQKDALFIGIAQVFALVPGVSRSGITIVAGMARGYKREAAARFSFMLSTPIVAGACMLEGRKLLGAEPLDLKIFFTGIAASAVTGFFVIKYLLYFLQKHTLKPFAYYRFLLASVIIFTIWTRSAG